MTIAYEDRCAFGQGWESRRLKRQTGNCPPNPYPPGSFLSECWENGYKDFRWPKLLVPEAAQEKSP